MGSGSGGGVFIGWWVIGWFRERFAGFSLR
jgi:hypothetical protein